MVSWNMFPVWPFSERELIDLGRIAHSLSCSAVNLSEGEFTPSGVSGVDEVVGYELKLSKSCKKVRVLVDGSPVGKFVIRYGMVLLLPHVGETDGGL